MVLGVKWKVIAGVGARVIVIAGVRVGQGLSWRSCLGLCRRGGEGGVTALIKRWLVAGFMRV